MKRLIIFGAGGHGKVVADIAAAMGCFSEIAFVDDNANGTTCSGFPVLGTMDAIKSNLDDSLFVVAIGNNAVRKLKTEMLENMGAEMATLLHPSVVIGSGVCIGSGTVVMPGAVINADAEIGKGVIINTGATVDHECEIGDYTHIAVGANIAGQVTIGSKSMIGAGAVVINNVTVCENCVIGAGAVVINDIKEKGTYVGVPARRYK